MSGDQSLYDPGPAQVGKRVCPLLAGRHCRKDDRSDIHNRVTSMQDGTGMTGYTYNPYLPYASPWNPAPTTGAGREATEAGPLGSSTLAYGYDERGKVVTRSINASVSTTAYDALARVSGVANPLGSFTYGYQAATPRVTSLSYPNGQSTTYTYFPLPADPRLQDISNLNSAGAVISKFDYTYAPNGDITTWTQQTDAATPNAYSLLNDAADQLSEATLTNTATQALINRYDYGYDAAGNRTSEQINLGVTSASHNTLNQLVSRQTGGPLRVAGTLSEPAAVTLNGTSSAVVSGTSFVGTVTATTGTNNIQISAKDAAGNTTTHTWQVVATSGTNQTLTYDPDGNLLNDGTQTYEWDAANRLTAVNEAGNLRSEFTYDGLSRRVKIIEKSNGAVTSTKNLLWCGTEICEERDASNNVTRRYYPQGMQLSGSNYFYTRDHLGSIRELTDSSGVIQARYSYDPYGRRTKLSGSMAADFGFTGDYWHAPSHLALSLYRGYNADLGRWISRDPVAERGGINLYEYVGSDPSNSIDELGLWQFTYFGSPLIGGLGLYLSFGHNDFANGPGQWNLSLRIGGGFGTNIGLDLTDEGCKKKGWTPLTIAGGIGGFVAGGSGEVNVNSDGSVTGSASFRYGGFPGRRLGDRCPRWRICYVSEWGVWQLGC